MLRKKTKTFAPAKVGARKPGAPSSTPSSARPSVEPRGQSQTPAPTQTQPETIDLEAQVSSVSSATPISHPFDHTNTSSLREEIRGQSIVETPEQETSTSNINLKRKAGDDITETSTKRVAIEANQNTLRAPEITITSARNEVSPTPNQDYILQNRTAQEHNLNLGRSSRETTEDREQSLTRQTSPGSARQLDGGESQLESTSRNPSASQLAITSENVQARTSPLVPSIETSQNTATSPLLTPQSAQRIPPPHSSDLHSTGERQRSESESQDETPEPPRYRYPSPDNIPPIAGQVVSVSPGPASMGPPGGGTAVIVGPVAAGPELVLSATLNPDGSSAVAQISAADSGKAKKPKRQYTKKKKVQTIEDGERANLSLQLNKTTGDNRRVRAKKKKEKKSRKKRDETPEGAEDEEIDATTMTMSELCSDLKIGKKSRRHDEIKERLQKQKAELAKEKFRKSHPELVTLVGTEERTQEGETRETGEEGTISTGNEAGPSGNNGEENNDVEDASPGPMVGSGPKMRIVDGHLVLDESSLQIDRHKRAEADGLITKTVEENEFTRVITAGTYMKRERAQQWDDDEMDLFYKGLRMFGTDFQMISQMFPTRNRRQIKLKFNSEEKKNPRMITKALLGIKEEIDMEEFQQLSNVKLEPVEVIRAEHEAFEAQQNADLDREAAAQAEETRQKKASIHAGRLAAKNLLDSVELSEDEDQPGGSAKENSDPRGKGKGKAKQKAKPRKNKNKHSMHGGGEEVIVDGRID